MYVVFTWSVQTSSYQILLIAIALYWCTQGKVQKNEKEKKLTSVSFMYVCVAGNGEMLFFFPRFFPPNYSLIDNSLSE